MNSKKRWIVFVLAPVLILSLLAAGCAPREDVGEQKEKVLVMAFARDAETLDHIRTSWYSDALIYIFDRLVSRDYDFNFRPGLAERWETSPDGLVWTFKLRDGVKFHNGKEFSAEDVKWTLDTILDPETASPFAADLAAIEKVEVIDPLTVEITLKHPFPNLLFNLSSTAAGIAPKDAYAEFGEEWGSTVLYGTGPFMFDEWIKGDRIVLVRNPDYNWAPEWMTHRGPPLIDKVVLRTIPEEAVRLMELKAGGVHIVRDIPAPWYEQLEGSPDVKVVPGSATRLGYLAFATDRAPFDNVLVRRAINHAVDRESIVQYIFRGLAQPAYGYLPPALTADYYEGSERAGYKFNPERAKQLLAEAGFPDGFTATLAADNSTTSQRLAEVLQHQLKQVGIDTQINLMDMASYTEFLREGKQELFIRLYSWPNADILDWFLHSRQFPFPNHSRWVDETTDRLIDAAARKPTMEERSVAYKEVQRHLIYQAVWSPIYVPDVLVAVRREVKNFRFHPWQLMLNDGFDLEVAE